MIAELMNPKSLDVYWTTMWRNNYRRLFKPISQPVLKANDVPPAGPDSDHGAEKSQNDNRVSSEANDLTFRFSPEFHDIINPDKALLPEGCDAWALAYGHASVTPLLASYAELESGVADAPQKLADTLSIEKWKLKL